jgi:hypothetical protein
MTDTIKRILISRPEVLVALMESMWQGAPLELSVTLSGMLVAVLDQPMAFPRASDQKTDDSSDSISELGLERISIAQALLTPATTLERLITIKDEFKGRRMRAANSNEAAVTSAIYYTAIAAALKFHQTSITGLDQAELAQAMTWVLDQPWIDPRCRDLAAHATKQLTSPTATNRASAD